MSFEKILEGIFLFFISIVLFSFSISCLIVGRKLYGTDATILFAGGMILVMLRVKMISEVQQNILLI